VRETTMKKPQGKIVQLHGESSEEEERQDRIHSLSAP
jgi:hypothetical protein